jgi:hypothetical protein
MTITEPRTSTPIPAGRGRWRVTLHQRTFAGSTTWQASMIAELGSARGRRLEQAWNTPAQFTFTLDGRKSEAGMVSELANDVYVWRWDETSGSDIAMFRGLVTQSEDQVTEQSHTVTFTCHDYLALLGRRLITSTMTFTGNPTTDDQDRVMDALLDAGTFVRSSSGTTLAPGSFIPLVNLYCNPDGSQRPTPAGVPRVRTYFPSQQIQTAIDDLSKVDKGFDYDVACDANSGGTNMDWLRIFYPYQGVPRNDVPLVYGSTISAFTRSLNSGDYANYWRVLGNNGSSDPNAAQLYAEAWNTDANNITQAPQGLWMSDDNAADVNTQATLTDKARGNLAQSSLAMPSYTLALRPGAYTWGKPNMGDVCPLIINTGRLNVNTAIRVLGISYDIGDSGQEDVSLTVGRPLIRLSDMFNVQHQAINALTRR